MPSANPVIKAGCFLLTAVLLLTACANQAVQTLSLEPPQKNDAVLHIYRPDELANVLVDSTLVIDATQQFTLTNKHFLSVHLASGQHRIELQLPPRYLGVHEVNLDMVAGQSYFLRIDSHITFQQNRPYQRRFDVLVIRDSEALPQILLCKPFTSTQLASPTPPAANKPSGYSSETFRNPFSH